MTRTLLGVALLVTGVLVVLLLRARGGKEKLIVRFPGAWIIVGLLLTFWIGTGAALIAAGILGG
jgi:hypothetical protein